VLKVKKQSANRVDIELNGSLDAIEMRVGLDALIEQSKDVSHGHMLYKISDFSFPTLGAIGVEMSLLPAMFALLGKYDKCAVLCDTGWLRTAAEIEGALFPGIDIKSFEFNKDAEAETWLLANE
jgi:hypothetical protein